MYVFPKDIWQDNTLTLEEYVNRPDPTYTYYELNRTVDQYHATYYLNMTSQKWMDGDK